MKKLFNSFIALEKIEDDEEGIFIPASVQERKPKVGTVVAFDGDNIKDISIGDKIVFIEYAIHPVELNDKEILFIKHEDIICSL